MLELLLLLVPMLLGPAIDEAADPMARPPGVPSNAVRATYAGHVLWLWDLPPDPDYPGGAIGYTVIAPTGIKFAGGITTTMTGDQLVAELHAQIDAKYVPQGGGAPPVAPPLPPAEDVPPVCAQIITVEADGRTGMLCKQGAVWRLYRDGDRLLPARYVDPGKAAQRMITLLHANDAALITITTSTAWAELRRLGGGQYGWRVQSTTPAAPGGVGTSTSASGVGPSLLDAMGSAYEAAGGL